MEMKALLAAKRFGQEQNEDSIEMFMDFAKEDVFAKKKLQEEQEEYKKYQKKKEAVKRFQTYEERLNKDKIKESIDWTEPNEKQYTLKDLKDPETGMPDISKIKDETEFDKKKTIDSKDQDRY